MSAPHSRAAAGVMAEAPAAQALQAALDHARHHLPAQRPLDAFVHHNTLHAYEDLPFEAGVEAAAAHFGAEPWLAEAEYRAAYDRGRIRDADLSAAVARRVPDEDLPGLGLGRRAATLRLMLHLPAEVTGARLAWRLTETRVLTALPERLPRTARERLLSAGPPARVLPALWTACGGAAWAPAGFGMASGPGGAGPGAAAPVGAGLGGGAHASPPRRPAEAVRRHTGEDPDARVNPLMIRYCAAFLDPGFAAQPMAHRAQGFFAAVCQHLAAGPEPRRWLAPVARAARRLRADGTTAAASALATLARMGVAPTEFDAVVEATLAVLPGWAGMFDAVTARPDLTPGPVPPAALMDFLAVRLLLDEAAATAVQAECSGEADGEHPGAGEGAVSPWTRFHAACALGLVPDQLLGAEGAATRAALDALVLQTDSVRRRRLWHLAYERHFRQHILDGLRAPRPAAAVATAGLSADSGAPWLQVVTCIDDRNESLRRHLEEVAPGCETFGAAGFFGVAMAFRALGEARARPLCPGGVVPRHLVVERAAPGAESAWARARRVRTATGRLFNLDHQGHRGLVRGGTLALLGLWAAVPMAGRLLAPRRHGNWVAGGVPQVATALELWHRPEVPPEEGLQVGFTAPEMVGMVGRLLTDLGLAAPGHDSRLAPLVLLLGHGSHSVNNPYAAGYNCGACGGGRGGPNARAFALMANDPAVRAGLAAAGFAVPADTWFVGGYYDTTSEDLRLADLDAVPARHRVRLERALATLEAARRRNAHERCRRFEDTRLDLSEAEALARVEGRSHDLAQARPEYNHASNALQILGRRALSRGLFLDRRAFLTSYAPAVDPDGRVLERILGAVGPVGAGINLEYFFSFVDRRKYGCDSKLPQNLVSLLGMMDGHQSDLRTGLVWQMVEIHEPMRLLNIIEARPETILKVLDRLPAVARLVRNEWTLMVAWDPETDEMWCYEDGAFRVQPPGPEAGQLPEVACSLDWYGGNREHLPLARIVPSTLEAGLSERLPEVAQSGPGAASEPAAREARR